MEYIETPQYFFKKCSTSISDVKRIQRSSRLYNEFDSGSNFQLTAGIYRGTWLSGGSNERRVHAKRYPYREALHAEQIAIMSARCNLEGSTLYVSRLSEHDGLFKLARPCFWCMHNILKAGISKVVYTDDEYITAFKTATVEIKPLTSVDIDYQTLMNIAS